MTGTLSLDQTSAPTPWAWATACWRHTEVGELVTRRVTPRSASWSLVATRARLDVVWLCRRGVIACLVARFFGTAHRRRAALMAGDRRDTLLFGDLLLR